MIKVIFLDMGGIIVKEAGMQQIELLAEHSGLSFDECKNIRRKYWSELKIGKITDEEYWIGAKKISCLKKGLLDDLGISKDKYELLRQESIEFIAPIENSENLLKRLSKHYVLIIVSNNSYDWGENVLKRLDYEKYFLDKIFSHNVGCSKPGKEIFEIALDKIKQKIDNNSEVLFIDDKDKNLLIPKQMGIRTHLFSTYDEIYSVVRYID
ncbi:MAG: NIF family HAD-type phosphatase [Candidatus Woesearchaeota archaeon]